MGRSHLVFMLGIAAICWLDGIYADSAKVTPDAASDPSRPRDEYEGLGGRALLRSGGGGGGRSSGGSSRSSPSPSRSSPSPSSKSHSSPSSSASRSNTYFPIGTSRRGAGWYQDTANSDPYYYSSAESAPAHALWRLLGAALVCAGAWTLAM